MTQRIEAGQAPNGGAIAPPSGFIAMLFTDIEGSTRLAASLAERSSRASE